MLIRLIGKTFAFALDLQRLRGNGHNRQRALPHPRTVRHQGPVKPPSRWRLCLSLLLHRNRDSNKQRGPVFTRRERRKSLFLQYVRFGGASKFHMRRVRESTVYKNRGVAQDHRHTHQTKNARHSHRELPPQVVPFKGRRFK